jgi:hypothetical protein
MYTILNKIFFVPVTNIYSYYDLVKSSGSMERVITSILKNSSGASLFIIYYSGHGSGGGGTSYFYMPDGSYFDDQTLKTLIKNYSGRNYVVLLEDGMRVERDVEIGLETGTDVEIVSGLEPGEQVIKS